MYVCMCVCVCLFVFMCARVHVGVCVLYVSLFVCMYVRVCCVSAYACWAIVYWINTAFANTPSDSFSNSHI